MINTYSCSDCGHIQEYIKYGNKSKYDSVQKCMVYLSSSGEWIPQPEQKCLKCGSLNLHKDFSEVNIDFTMELRDKSSPRHWKKQMSVTDQSKVLTGEKNPY